MLKNLIKKTFNSVVLIAATVILLNNHINLIPAARSEEDKQIQEAIERSLEEEAIKESIRLEKERQFKVKKREQSEQEEKARHALEQAIRESLKEGEKTRLKETENADLEKAIQLSIEHEKEQKIRDQEDATERANLEEAVRLSLEQEEKKEKEEVNEVPFHDVIVLLDTSERDGLSPITNTLAIALCQKSAPIITSSHTLKNYLNNMATDKYYLRFADMLKQSLDDKFWDFYVAIIKENSFYLLIPKTYSQGLNGKFNTVNFRENCKNYPQYSPEEIILGFRIDPKSKIFKKVSSLELKNNVQLTPNYLLEEDTLEQLFTQGKDEIFGLWNIYLLGHGYYAQQNLIDIAKIKNISEMDFANTLIGGFNLINFKKLTQFLNKNINTNLFYYASCYAGGYNILLAHLTNFINKKGNIVGGIEKPNFTVVAGSVTDQEIAIPTDFAIQCVSQPHKIPAGYIDFVTFFEFLHKYTKKTGINSTIFKDPELIDILNTVTTIGVYKKDPYGIMNIPQIMQPKTGIFRAIALNKNIGIITEVSSLIYKQNNAPIILDDKKVIFIYPKEIEAKIQIQAHGGKPIPAIVSMLPGVGIHKFEYITANLSFLNFMHSLAASRPAFEKYFYIKQLELFNDKYGVTKKAPGGLITLHNVIIKIKGKIISIIFSDDKKNIYFNAFTRKKGFQNPTIILDWKFSNKYKNDEFMNTVYNYFIFPKSTELQLMLGSAFNYDTLFSFFSSKELRTLTKIK